MINKSKYIKCRHIVVLYIILIFNYSLIAQSKVSGIETTTYFEFHNNFWINLHFYLYETAAASYEKPLDKLVKKEVWQKLSQKEKLLFQKTITYYKDHIDLKNHFNQELIGFRKWIINYTEQDMLPESRFEILFIKNLNDFKRIYSTHFWKTHRQINTDKLQENIDLIKKTEDFIISRIAKLAQAKWQDTKIRIDLSIKSPGGGAFTLSRTPSSIVLSTIINYPEIAGDWVETLFHEASHTVIKGRKGAIAESINRVSEKLKVKPPKNLWHAILFYITGKVSQKAFLGQGINEYTIYMDRENIFSFYHNAIYKHFTSYLVEETDLDIAIENVINSVSDKLELARTITTFNTAFKEGNVAKLESLITDNYRHTNGTSKSIGKNAWLEYLKKRKKDIDDGRLVVTNYDMKETQLELYENFAIITAKIITTDIKERNPIENQYRVSHVWIKEGNIWKRAGFHDSKIELK
ncbi:nuclear transport factor 2 family protein [Aquimarina spinulae]|uniref:nuclear transport factor 2 family protein n=1 Tax=Aquimarina spinulae TaxID=1192023 RepID=UPI000D550896|nr:nuclear transport factor 2 family protein [Aquimarina spinulae]